MSYSDSKSDQPSAATRLYNPYQDLHLPSQTLYHLPTSPEFLFTEESLRQRRSWGENLTFYTGSAYLTASLAGGGSGFFSALRSFEPTDTLKLKVNRILNSSGHSGRIWGNRVGIGGFIYAMMESGIVAVTDRDDVWSSVAAGLGTGAVCRAARGVRSAAVAGALGGLAAGAVVAGKQALKRYAMI
ncbi:PREDICTED: mitochondrial import inner membrane translocase subunit TIM23-1-like [Populus euphratica]|uniref:Mitochondrial import inner membrane translocase subunit TIM23-1-like n=1 Tax=Populus euphratica TaxID=75702 RepID=A0AAJ6TF22_POPEU|nr:PREDICTED: mitochondrial import inner membrane translocase subunit TIM23-1-like [Populus euphratica]